MLRDHGLHPNRNNGMMEIIVTNCIKKAYPKDGTYKVQTESFSW